MQGSFNRRRFLGRLAGGGAGWLVLQGAASARSYRANEKLGVAMVGLGLQGTSLANAVLRIGENLVALCDVDARRAEPWRQKVPRAAWYADFRKMLDERAGQIDAVMAALPPHNHAVVGAAAMHCERHIYLEKPLAQNVAEARALRQIAGQSDVATQMGNQGMATNAFRRTLELIEEGALGEIREVHIWFTQTGPDPRQPPAGSEPVPAWLDWDLWLGPLPFRPYHPDWMACAADRAIRTGVWREISAGVLGRYGSHPINLAFKSLRMGALWGAGGAGAAEGTIRVEAEVSERSDLCFPRWEVVRFDVPPRGPLPAVRIHWYSAPDAELERQGIWKRLEGIAGRRLPRGEGFSPGSGSLLVGSRGVVLTNAHTSVCELLPKDAFPGEPGPPRSLPSVRGHKPEWLNACRGGPRPMSHFEVAGPPNELLLLGNIATRFPAVLEFDPRSGRIANHAEADAALSREYREGWSL